MIKPRSYVRFKEEDEKKRSVLSSLQDECSTQNSEERCEDDSTRGVPVAQVGGLEEVAQEGHLPRPGGGRVVGAGEVRQGARLRGQ